MSTPHSDSGSIGKDADAVNDESVSNDAFEAAFGFDADDASATKAVQSASYEQQQGAEFPTREEMWAIITRQQEQIDDLARNVEDLQETVEGLRETVEKKNQAIRAQAETITTLEEQVDELETNAEKARHTRKELLKSVRELADDSTDEPTTNEQSGPAAASSSLDFFLNNDQYYVNQSVSENRARAVETVRRHAEFATTGRGGNTWFRREDVREALTAIMGKSPHRQTIARVYEKIDDLGGTDVRESSFGSWKANGGEKALRIDPETIERFEEGRYVGMGLLAGTGSTGSAPDALTTVVTATG